MVKKLFFFLILFNVPLYSQKNQITPISPHNVIVSGFFGMAANDVYYGYGGGFNFGYLGLKETGSLIHGVGLRIGLEGYSYGAGAYYYYFTPTQYFWFDSIYATANFTYSVGFRSGKAIILLDAFGVGGGVGGTSLRVGVWNGFFTQETATSYGFQSKVDIILPFGFSVIFLHGWYAQLSHKLSYLFNPNQTLTDNPVEYFLTIGIGWIGGSKQPKYSGNYSSGVLPPL